METSAFGIAGFMQHVHDHPVALTILLILLFMSILSWYLIVTKSLRLMLIAGRSRRFQRRFWEAADLDEVIAWLRRHGVHDPYSRLAQKGLSAALSHEQASARGLEKICPHSEFITRSLRHGIDDERERINAGLSILASIGSTAPFVGLLGTVIGIYSALVNISAQGSASLDTVAGPVGEALIMTAIGLGVAIPAVMFYNGLVKINRGYLHRLETFANDLHAYLNAGIHLHKQDLSMLAATAPPPKAPSCPPQPRMEAIA